MTAVGKWVAGIVAGLIVTVLGALILARIQSAPEPDPDPDTSSQPTAIYLNKDSGPAGTTVRVSGQGFAAGEEITLRFHTETVGHTGADGQGKFEAVTVEVPADWQFTGQFSFVATGESSIRSAQREFRVT